MQKVAIATFYCPSRRSAKAYPAKQSRNMNNYNLYSPCGKIDFAGNAGVSLGEMSGSGGIEGVGASTIATYHSKNTWPNYSSKSTGVFFAYSQVSVGEIRDGMSNAYLIGEKQHNPDCYEDLKYGTSNEDTNGDDDYSPFTGAETDFQRGTWTGNYDSSGVFQKDNSAYIPFLQH